MHPNAPREAGAFHHSPRRAVLGTALALPSLFLARRAAAQAVQWTRIPGAAFDIGANGGKVWAIGANPLPGGYGIYRWNGRTSGAAWDNVPGSATDITVDDSGNPWVVTAQGTVFEWLGGRFEGVAGRASDIGAGGGQVYVIGTNASPGGYGIYRYAGGGRWTQLPGGAVRIAVDRTGAPWVVNDQGNIFVLKGNSWEQVAGRARDIGCGGGEVFAVGTNTVPGGASIYRLQTQSGTRTWRQVNGGAIRIAVDAQGTPWVVNEAGHLFKG
jgi:hypothetical protein